MKKVTKEEHEQFVVGYPNQLHKGVSTIYDPPVLEWNDFSLGDWPKSIVAAETLEYDHETCKDTPEKNQYWIEE